MAVLTSITDVQPFLNRETVETDLDGLQKSELLLIAQYGSFEVSATMNKQELKQKVREHLGFTDDSVDAGQLGSEGGNTPDGSSGAIGRRGVGVIVKTLRMN